VNLNLIFDFLPPCPFYTTFNLYCPACGNTRSLEALLRGEFIAALRYNITIPFLVLLAAAFLTELIFRAFGKRMVIVPRKNAFLFGVIGFFLVYYVVRNFFPFA
jgi:hypothetical protein